MREQIRGTGHNGLKPVLFESVGPPTAQMACVQLCTKELGGGKTEAGASDLEAKQCNKSDV